MGYLQSYNFTMEKDVGRGAVVEAAYVGSKGTHLGRQYNINLPFRTIPSFLANGTTFPFPYPQLNTINYWGFGSNSIYGAGQVTIRKRAAGGFFYRLSYSYSKSIDVASQFSSAPSKDFAGALDPRNLRLERGRSDSDRGHMVTGSFAYPLPVGRSKWLLSSAGKLVNGALGGWQLSGTVTFYSGWPFTVQDSTVNANLGESTRPNRIASGRDVQGTGRRGVDYPWYDPVAFVHTAACVQTPVRSCSPDQYGFQPFAPGNSGRGILDASGTQNVNLSMIKRFTVGERKSVQLRWEAFNIFNHPNFLVSAANFRNYNETAAGYFADVACSGQGGPRIMRFALRYEF